MLEKKLVKLVKHEKWRLRRGHELRVRRPVPEHATSHGSKNNSKNKE
jgi:hypothetical protein